MATTKKSAKKAVLKDPRGGLTAAGRKAFKEKEGSNLRPGVTKPESEMTPEDTKRKGSFLRRHFANPRGPMQDEKGEPTRLALSAHAWGEKVPKTEADAKKLAEKGIKLLDKAKNAGIGGEKGAAKKSAAKKAAGRKK